MAGSEKTDWRSLATSARAVVAVWVVYCLLRLALLPLTGTDPVGPDDYMRLFEVRDLLAGQSWWDVTQYRVNPPEGASMHWSRLVDLPLAGVALVAGLFMSSTQAELAAMVIVPLLYLLPALFALRAIMLKLGLSQLAMAFGLVILPLFPLLPGNFVPLRIDHHAPQAVLGLICAAMLLRETRGAAIIAGILAAAWVVISLEGLPVIAALAGIYGILYLWVQDRRIAYFLGALAVSAPLLSLATRPVSAFALPFCDILLPGHMAAFAAAALIAAALPFLPGQGTVKGRLLALGAIGLVCAPLAYVTLGDCATDPFSRLDPLLQSYWHGLITEGLPIWRQPVSVAAMLIWTAMLVIGGWWVAARDMEAGDRRAMAWTALALLALVTCFYSFWLMRAAIVAQLLAIPFAAFLLGRFLPKARAIEASLPRIVATLACFGLATPTFASAAFKRIDPMFPTETMSADTLALIDGGQCDYTGLADLSAGHILAPLDNGPEMLAKSDHTIVMASYHRNQQQMHEVIAAFTGPVEQARVIANANNADYVIACSAEADVALYRTADPANFVNVLVSGDVPDWLEPAEGFEQGSLHVYRVK